MEHDILTCVEVLCTQVALLSVRGNPALFLNAPAGMPERWLGVLLWA